MPPTFPARFLGRAAVPLARVGWLLGSRRLSMGGAVDHGQGGIPDAVMRSPNYDES